MDNRDDEDPELIALLEEMAKQSEETNQRYRDYIKNRKPTLLERIFVPRVKDKQ